MSHSIPQRPNSSLHVALCAVSRINVALVLELDDLPLRSSTCSFYFHQLEISENCPYCSLVLCGKVTVNVMQGVNNAAKREKQLSLPAEVTTATVYVWVPHNIPESLSVIQITKHRFQIR